MKKQIEIEKEIDRKNEKITEEILSGRARLIDLTDYRTREYVKCKGVYAEIIEGRMRIAFVTCPKCRKPISVYKDEMTRDDGHTRQKRCLCGFSKTLELIDWKKNQSNR